LDTVQKLSYSSSFNQTQTKIGPILNYAGSPPANATWDNLLVTYTGAVTGSPWYYYAMKGGIDV